MRLRHLVGLLVLTLTLGVAAPAASAQYPPTVGSGRVTRSEVKQCQCTQFSGDGFEPGSTVSVFDRGPNGVEKFVGTATVDGKGGFKMKVCFDEKAQQGEHTLIGRGTGSDGAPREVRSTVIVRGDACWGKDDEIHKPNVGGKNDGEEPRGPNVGGNGSGLPKTGAGYVVPGLLLGFLLVVTGTAVVHLTRRRRLVTS